MVLYQNIRRVSVLEEALYYYCDNGASLTHVFRKDRYKKIKYFHQACIKKANELKYSSKIKLRLAGPYYNFTLAAMKMIVMSKNKKQEKIEALNEIILDQYLRNVLETLDVGKKDKKKIKKGDARMNSKKRLSLLMIGATVTSLMGGTVSTYAADNTETTEPVSYTHLTLPTKLEV